MNFTTIHWKPKMLLEYGLPDVGYPVPIEAFDGLLSGGGVLPLAQLLCWIQECSEESESDWQGLQAASLRLTELLASQDDRNTASAGAEEWFIEFGRVDLTQHIVTIQRGDTVLVALAPRPDGSLRAAMYCPLDAKALRYLLGLSRRPDPEHGVCMRANNWEYARDQAAHSTGAIYAYSAGSSYLSVWEYGLGLDHDRKVDPRFTAQKDRVPMAPNLAATHLGVFYSLCAEL